MGPNLAFATNSVNASSNGPPVLSHPQKLAGGGFSFVLAGAPLTTYFVQATTNLTSWRNIATNTLPANGLMTVSDATATGVARKYYRVMKAP